MNNPQIAQSDWMVPNNVPSTSGSEDKIFYNFISNQNVSENGVNFEGDSLNNDFGAVQLSGDMLLIHATNLDTKIRFSD